MGHLNANPTKGPQKIMANKCSEATYWLNAAECHVYFQPQGLKIPFNGLYGERSEGFHVTKPGRLIILALFQAGPIILKDSLTADTVSVFGAGRPGY